MPSPNPDDPYAIEAVPGEDLAALRIIRIDWPKLLEEAKPARARGSQVRPRMSVLLNEHECVIWADLDFGLIRLAAAGRARLATERKAADRQYPARLGHPGDEAHTRAMPAGGVGHASAMPWIVVSDRISPNARFHVEHHDVLGTTAVG